MTTRFSFPTAFLWRRLHSLTGLFFSLFLIEHLLINSQAALFIGEDGKGFVEAVNAIQNLPYLPVIELVLLGFPFLLHLIWGIKYLRTGDYFPPQKEGRTPDLSEYPRFRFYRLQRFTAWILVFGVVVHVIQMRFVERPASQSVHGHESYAVRLDQDRGLTDLAERLG